MFGLSPLELLVVGAVAVLLFGNKLPDVARSLGKSFTEFKTGVQGMHDEVRQATRMPPPRRYNDLDDRDEPTAPKFEPPTS